MTTADDLRTAMMVEHLHGHGDSGAYLYGYTCVEFPRLTKFVSRPSFREPATSTFAVDGRELPPGATLDDVATALGAPHDLEGIAERLAARMLSDRRVAFEAGRLVVTGETKPSRIEKLRRSLPSFEGIPVEWVVPEGEEVGE